jgi:hypothetical protein
VWDLPQYSGFGWISGKTKLLERSEEEACRRRSPAGDDKSASKISESKTREESDGRDTKNVRRDGFPVADWWEMSREV